MTTCRPTVQLLTAFESWGIKLGSASYWTDIEHGVLSMTKPFITYNVVPCICCLDGYKIVTANSLVTNGTLLFSCQNIITVFGHLHAQWWQSSGRIYIYLYIYIYIYMHILHMGQTFLEFKIVMIQVFVTGASTYKTLTTSGNQNLFKHFYLDVLALSEPIGLTFCINYSNVPI